MKRESADLRGRSFGALVALWRVLPHRGPAKWVCLCSLCREYTEVFAHNLLRGRTSRCDTCRRTAMAPGQAARNQLLLRYQGGAARRGLSWLLSDDQFDVLTSSACVYCGAAPQVERICEGGGRPGKGRTRSQNGSYLYNGIDRVDNARGYEPDNCVPCCGICNRAKGAMSYVDFIAWLDRIVTFRSSR